MLNKPSTQVIARWVIDAAGETPERLDVLVNRILMTKLAKNSSPDELADLAEEEVKKYLPNELRDLYNSRIQDGGVAEFDIDDEPIPYITSANPLLFKLRDELQKITPKNFEEICALILEKLGGNSTVSGQPGDGGVDFYSFGLSGHARDLPLPIKSTLLVIGQAKRHKTGNDISESDLRKFVGGATRIQHNLRNQYNLGILTPVIYAFWTTANFEKNAKDFAQSLGMWHMDGFTLSKYVVELGLTASLKPAAIENKNN